MKFGRDLIELGNLVPTSSHLALFYDDDWAITVYYNLILAGVYNAAYNVLIYLRSIMIRESNRYEAMSHTSPKHKLY